MTIEVVDWSPEMVWRAVVVLGNWLDAQERGTQNVIDEHRYEPAQRCLVEYYGSLAEFHGTALLGGWCSCDECNGWERWDQQMYDRALLIGRDRAGELRPLVGVRRKGFTLPRRPVPIRGLSPALPDS